MAKTCSESRVLPAVEIGKPIFFTFNIFRHNQKMVTLRTNQQTSITVDHVPIIYVCLRNPPQKKKKIFPIKSPRSVFPIGKLT